MSRKLLVILALMMVTGGTTGCCGRLRDFFYRGAYCNPGPATVAPVYAAPGVTYAAPQQAVAAPAAVAAPTRFVTPAPVAAPTQVVMPMTAGCECCSPAYCQPCCPPPCCSDPCCCSPNIVYESDYSIGCGCPGDCCSGGVTTTYDGPYPTEPSTLTPSPEPAPE